MTKAWFITGLPAGRRDDGPRSTPSGENGLAGPRAEKTVSLALQGGGAHGAFTWGVLDALLEDGRLAVEAITGASAGAMNAVVMVQGWLEGGIDGARSALETFWRRASLDGSLSRTQRRLLSLDARLLEQPGLEGCPRPHGVSPYSSNPLNINPLRDALAALIDFERVRACTEAEIFVSATNVWTGEVEIFKRQELTADHLMASACLPTSSRRSYRRGALLGRRLYRQPGPVPALLRDGTDDILLVQINPLERRETPRTASEIHDRLNEITFNANLLRELRAVEFVSRLIEEGKLSMEEYKKVRMHRIDVSGVLDDYEASSKRNAEWDFFVQLRDAGRRTAQSWLADHYGAIGVRGTLDLQSALL